MWPYTEPRGGLALFGGALLVSLGCAEDTIEWQAPEVVPACLGESCAEAVSPLAVCEVVLCLAGAAGDLSVGNELLGEVCERLPGVVRRCDSAGCRPLFDDVSSALAALEEVTGRIVERSFHRRDAGSEQPTAAAEACRISLLGHSWGALNAVELAALVMESEDVPVGLRRVDRAVLIDAYSPFAGAFVDVPGGVGQAWSYRHSAPNPDDCSGEMPLGPYVGLPIRCSDESCAEHDSSLWDGSVSHCGIISDVEHCVFENLVEGTDCRTPPPAVPVLRR